MTPPNVIDEAEVVIRGIVEISQKPSMEFPWRSNHCLNGGFANFTSRSRVRANPGKNGNDNAIEKKCREHVEITCSRNRVRPRSSLVPSSILVGYSAVSKRCPNRRHSVWRTACPLWAKSGHH